jgi:outer membrane protein assembly factor BamB
LYEDKVILVLDGDGGSSRLLAVNRDTGETVWEQPRSLFKAGWSTPMIFRHGDTEELVVLGSKRLTSYNPSTGAENWWAGGFPQDTVGIPVTGDKIVVASVPGTVTVIQVDDKLKVLAKNKFGQKIFATPAVAENKIYLRTSGHLYALGQ